MNDTLETFVPLTFRRRGARRVAADERYVHDVTLLEGGTRFLLAAPRGHRCDEEWIRHCPGRRTAPLGAQRADAPDPARA